MASFLKGACGKKSQGKQLQSLEGPFTAKATWFTATLTECSLFH